ncbi:DUF1289 domain-containing protein [Methylobacterium trifolii]|uniref:DUF1289 domain-containing protein n=1 Tax=Methylobacterium trifolii TaxID=1003092 RepID=A0ABQ4U4H3_9HYPH|nr:DUF1289 domain-containing protein [Methylobacterium trifolii]GJE61737.1 hypothetical protein MPOCJGCO_3862 [Methylobacterium trifolii]
MSLPAQKPSSPCTKVCVIDAASGLCLGCGRTRHEIGAWGGLTEPQRRTIMAGLEGRLRAARLSPVRGPAAS